jgi:hypothetical protein
MTGSELFDRRDLLSIAINEDPRIAAILSRMSPSEILMHRMRNTFTSGAAGQWVDLTLERYVVQDSIVIGSQIDILNENFPGNVLANLSYAQRMQYVTMIDADLRVTGEDQRVLVDAPIPLHHLFGPGRKKPSPRILSEGQQLISRCYLRRALTVSELPYVITVTLEVHQMSGCKWREMKYQDAIAELVSKGILPECLAGSCAAPPRR